MADRVGQQLGNYRLVRLLGQGGFADVYLGEHLYLGTQAAIKVLHTQLAGVDIEPFRNEARTIARLEHPHIVRVFDFGLEGTTPFLVMSYAPNGTLRKVHPKSTRLPLATIVSYIKQIASALQYAHDQKLIHRDIKPENFLVGRSNEILLSDFGIALVAQSSHYERTQDIVGTIPYMAPEQIQAHPRPASDQYSLGIVVYEWLSGERPFQGSYTEIAIKHSVMPPPSLFQQIPNLPPAVEQVVMKALAKDPKLRFSSVQAFAEALEQAWQVQHLSLPLSLPHPQPTSLPFPNPSTTVLSPSSLRIERLPSPPSVLASPSSAQKNEKAISEYGAPPPPNQYEAPRQPRQPGTYVGMRPTLSRPLLGLIIGIVVGVLALLSIGGYIILYAAGSSGVNTVNTSATSIAATTTASSNATPTTNVTPTTSNATPPVGQGTPPSSLPFDPTAASYITHPEMSSAVDSNFKPTAPTTTFTTGQTIYATFQIASSTPDGYVTAKWYTNGTYAFTSKVLAVKGGFVGYLAARYNVAAQGTVEYYYCTAQDCSDGKLADVLNFTVTATGIHSIGQPGVALTDMHKRNMRGHPEFF